MIISTILMGTAKTLMLSMFTEKMILQMILTLAEWACDKTTNSIDDKIVEDFKAKLEQDGKL